MRVILSHDVDHLGTVGDIVKVKPGYARNFLFPRGFAVLANEGNKAQLDHTLRVLEKKKAAQLAEAKELGSKIEKVSVTVSKQVGEDERIFGTVTSAEVTDLLNAEGFKVSKKDVTLSEDIKSVGVYSADVKLSAGVKSTFKVWVVAQ